MNRASFALLVTSCSHSNFSYEQTVKDSTLQKIGKEKRNNDYKV